MRYRLTFILLVSLQLAFAQSKQEHEKRIKASDFPETARSLIEAFSDRLGKVRYYKETDGEHHSYEAKFRHGGRLYSVEFDTKGAIEDVEIRIAKRDIPQNTLDRIETGLSDTYKRWKLEEIQLQYRPVGGDRSFLEQLLQDKQPHPPRYEIIVLTKMQGKVASFEYLFGPEGEVIKKRKVVRRSHVFLLF